MIIAFLCLFIGFIFIPSGVFFLKYTQETLGKKKKNRPDKITTIKESCLLRKLWYWLTMSKMGCVLGEAF